MLSAMTWKSTAFVSGAGLLATWLAATPTPTVAPASTSARPAATLANEPDIQQEAAQLRSRVRAEVEYSAPSRNPFRFTERATPSRPIAQPPAVIAPALEAAPAPIAIKLSGVAMDIVDGREQRTAILNTPAGLVFVHEGDEVAGGYRVKTIADDGVELVKSDGVLLQLR
jgi:hypothetical protein